MDEAGATRQAALGAVRDVEPAGLRERIDDWLGGSSAVPGVLTIHFARAATSTAVGPDGELSDPLSERAAGVQLIYEGLRLTRQLVHDEPWDDGETDAADLDVLVADVLVARGFFLLAKTEAADRAVETVRAFGRDQTVRREADDASLDANLEADALELAAVAGASLGEQGVPAGVRGFTAELAGSLDGDGFPPIEEVIGDAELEQLRALTTGKGGSDGLTTSVDD